MQRVLLLELASAPPPALAGELARCGFIVHVEREAATAVLQTAGRGPDALVLHACGSRQHTEVLRELSRAAPGAPIVVVLDDASEAGVVAYLSAGADSVILAPVSRRELAARLTALLASRRRLEALSPAQGAPYCVAGLLIDMERRTVTKNGAPVSLTPKEFRLLLSLARRNGRLATSEELLSEVWGTRAPSRRDALRLYVRYLREKLEDDDRRPKLVLNQRGVGYRLAAPAG